MSKIGWLTNHYNCEIILSKSIKYTCNFYFQNIFKTFSVPKKTIKFHLSMHNTWIQVLVTDIPESKSWCDFEIDCLWLSDNLVEQLINWKIIAIFFKRDLFGTFMNQCRGKILFPDLAIGINSWRSSKGRCFSTRCVKEVELLINFCL